jgi:lambda repressor-like predicted transcriptional regulator
MGYTDRHPEDVKAILRKRFVSLNNFERTHGLPIDSVSDLLRGRRSARVAAAVDAAIQINKSTPVSAAKPSDISEHSRQPRRVHRLNSKAA